MVAWHENPAAYLLPKILIPLPWLLVSQEGTINNVRPSAYAFCNALTGYETDCQATCRHFTLHHDINHLNLLEYHPQKPQ